MDHESAEGILEALQEGSALLRKRIRHADPILMRVKHIGAGVFSADVDKIYSRRFEGAIPYESTKFTFSAASNAWGNVGLSDGEFALVFVSRFSSDSKYHEFSWHGHFTVIREATHLLAIANWHLLDEKSSGVWGPEYLRESAFLLDQHKPNRVAIPYELLEKHIHEELMHANSASVGSISDA